MTQIALSRSAWLSQEEVAGFIAPSAEATTAVENAVNALGATGLTYSSIGDKLTLTTTVEKASQVSPL
jgi:tripeptidyl-peptidase-1